MDRPQDLARTWLFPLGLLVVVAGLLFFGALAIDASSVSDPADVFLLLFRPHPESAAAALSSAGEVAAGVLAVAVTVVAIIVELAATRYTHRATDLFLSESINFLVMGLFVVTALLALWVSSVFDPSTGFVPYAGITLTMVLLSLSLLILLPYFAYVFAFLSPVQLVERLRRATLRHMFGTGDIDKRRAETMLGLEQMVDIGQNALDHHDKDVALACANALHVTGLTYLERRGELPAAWFALDGPLAHDGDFACLDPEVRDEIALRKTWFEWKLLRQVQGLFGRSLGRMNDLPVVLAIHTRRFAQAALRSGNEEAAQLCLRFFNSYLREAIDQGATAAATDVLHQYRVLAERALVAGRDDLALRIARYFKLYGLLAFEARLPAVLEMAAHDIEQLNELAFERKSPVARELLRVFLRVDEDARSEVQETSLRGVRKAQVRLATYFLSKGNTWAAKEVFRDMEGEKPERLALIRDELMHVVSPEPWEVGGRGRNPDWLPADRRDRLREFFGWFEGRIPDTAASKRPSWLKTIVEDPEGPPSP